MSCGIPVIATFWSGPTEYLTNKNGTLVSEETYLTKIQKPIPETEEDIFNFLDYKYILPKFR
jgi:hypothetical protein